MDGLATAFDEITLVLFTTLAPSAAVAYILMALPYIVKGGAMQPAMRQGIDRFLSVPLFAAMVGLVASATHLGNPANALYVVSGFGSSPLSNEVVCGVVFLGSAGIFWLSSFSESAEAGRHVSARRVCLTIICFLGLVFVGTISIAYSVDTIITWNTPFAPASVWLNALVGGPVFAILGLRLARFRVEGHRFGKAILTLSAVACVANVVLYLIWGSTLPGIGNSLTTANVLAPFFVPLAAIFAALCAIGIYLSACAVARIDETPLWTPIAAIACVLAGIFVMRFLFYMLHMTVGLGI